MKEIRTEVLINAKPEKVWSVFSDFDTYPQWNPFIRSIRGEVSTGKTVRVDLAPPDAKPMTFRPEIIKITPSAELRWLGHLIIRGLFDGEHIFECRDNGNGTTIFIQREKFSGLLVPLFSKMLDDNTKRGFELMNVKLKERCE